MRCIICGEPLPLRYRERLVRSCKRELDYLKSEKSKKLDSPGKRLKKARKIREKLQVIIESDAKWL